MSQRSWEWSVTLCRSLAGWLLRAGVWPLWRLVNCHSSWWADCPLSSDKVRADLLTRSRSPFRGPYRPETWWENALLTKPKTMCLCLQMHLYLCCCWHLEGHFSTRGMLRSKRVSVWQSKKTCVLFIWRICTIWDLFLSYLAPGFEWLTYSGGNIWRLSIFLTDYGTIVNCITARIVILVLYGKKIVLVFHDLQGQIQYSLTTDILTNQYRDH